VRAAFRDERYPLQFRVKFEPEHSRYGLYVKSVPLIPIGVNLMIGDVLQNLRAALDHLAWQLVLHGADRDPRRPNLVQFPIYDTADQFRDWVDRRLPGVDVAQRDAVEGYQWYKHEGRGNVLRNLSLYANRDKHRLLPVVAAAPALTALFPEPTGCEVVGIAMPPGTTVLEEGAPVARFIIDPDTAQPGHKMKVHHRLEVVIAFLDSLSFVGDSLALVASVVEEVLNNPALQPGSVKPPG
jgi:hypothetical protein